jgi:hypothetical protein
MILLFLFGLPILLSRVSGGDTIRLIHSFASKLQLLHFSKLLYRPAPIHFSIFKFMFYALLPMHAGGVFPECLRAGRSHR